MTQPDPILAPLPCPFCQAPYGFHEEACSAGPLPEHLRHLLKPLSSDDKRARLAAGPRVRPSDEEIARLRAAKGRPARPDAVCWYCGANDELTREHQPSRVHRDRRREFSRDVLACRPCNNNKGGWTSALLNAG